MPKPKTKSKTAKKKSNSKRATAKKRTAFAKSSGKSRSARKSVRKKTTPKKKTPKARVGKKRPSSVNPGRDIRQDIQGRNLGRGSRDEDSGDLEGLSRAPEADSESVDELVDEGNAFEADAVAGVEEAGDSDEKEVRTHEVPEDDVPEEYLDEQ